jgi:hypothetical protein
VPSESRAGCVVVLEPGVDGASELGDLALEEGSAGEAGWRRGF